jgi:hypothetical protein
MEENDMMLVLERLRSSLDDFFKPETLDGFLKLREALGGDSGLVARYKWFSENSELGSNCRYAKMAKHYFLEENGENVIMLIKYLYDNFASKE